MYNWYLVYYVEKIMAHSPDRFLPIYSELELSLVNLCKSLDKLRLSLEVWKSLGQLQKYSDKLQLSLEVFGNVWATSEIFG